MEHVDYRAQQEEEMARDHFAKHGVWPKYEQPNSKKIIYPEEVWERDLANREHFHNISDIMRFNSQNPLG